VDRCLEAGEEICEDDRTCPRRFIHKMAVVPRPSGKITLVKGELVWQRVLTTVPALCLVSGQSSYYFGIGTARAVVRWLEGQGILILGLEGFTCDGRTVAPLIDHVADFSELAVDTDEGGVKTAAVAAEAIVEAWLSAEVQYVQFVVDEDR
jgi:hypothetical protein